jgi:hypothetical protein
MPADSSGVTADPHGGDGGQGGADQGTADPGATSGPSAPVSPAPSPPAADGDGGNGARANGGGPGASGARSRPAPSASPSRTGAPRASGGASGPAAGSHSPSGNGPTPLPGASGPAATSASPADPPSPDPTAAPRMGAPGPGGNGDPGLPGRPAPGSLGATGDGLGMAATMAPPDPTAPTPLAPDPTAVPGVIPPAPVLVQTPVGRGRRGRHASPKPDRASRRGLRVNQRLWSIDPWSVFKVSALFYLCMGLIILVAGTLLYNVGRSVGTVDQFESFVTRMGAYGTCTNKAELPKGTEFEQDDDCGDGQVLVGGFKIDDGTLFKAAAIGGGILVVAGSIGNVLLTVLINLLNEMTGGLRHTVIREPVARPQRGSPRGRPQR